MTQLFFLTWFMSWSPSIFTQQNLGPIYNLPDSVVGAYTRREVFSTIPIPKVLGNTFQLNSSGLLLLFPIEKDKSKGLINVISLLTGEDIDSSKACKNEIYLIGETKYIMSENLSTIFVYRENTSLGCGIYRAVYGLNLKDNKVISVHEVAAEVHDFFHFTSWSCRTSSISQSYKYYQETSYDDYPDSKYEQVDTITIGNNGKLKAF